ncbi:MAG: hexokinase [Treponema sp.]|nr:hexokinase [Treponema sp.]
MNNSVSSFLARHNFAIHEDVLSIAQGLLNDMDKGLKGEESDEDMIRTFCNPPKNTAEKQSVIVIDAGGSNFRSCLVSFDSQGKAEISYLEKTKMPGVEKELSKKEFFEQIAINLDHLKDKADRIGFCFSYPMEIKENGDGVLLGFSKEVKAPEVIGSEIGKCLKKTLEERGWKAIKRITLCNDTVAALLAGAACVETGNEYSSYIGMILGTGLNAAYIQPDNNEYKIKKQIIVCESGKYTSITKSDFDIEVDKKTTKPGSFILEKSCSGAYLGPLSYQALQFAAKENLFSKKVCTEVLKIENLTLIEVDGFLHGPYNVNTTLGKIMSENASEEDFNKMYQLLDNIAERCARHAAAILTACVIQTEAGKNASKPVCILCNGTTFFKTSLVKERVYSYLDEILTKTLDIYWKIVSCDNDITLGTAISGLID